MKRHTRFGIAVVLTTLLCAGPVLAQDPIDIMEDTVDGYISFVVLGGTSRPGRASEIRDDVLNLNYKILADIDPQRPGDEEIVKLTYTVNSLTTPGDIANEISKGSDGKLHFKVGSNQITKTCLHDQQPSQGGCVGSGMPIDLYGTAVVHLTAYETDQSPGVQINLAKFRSPAAP